MPTAGESTDSELLAGKYEISFQKNTHTTNQGTEFPINRKSKTIRSNRINVRDNEDEITHATKFNFNELLIHYKM